MSHKIILYGNHYSGHSYKVKLFLELTKTSHKYETISLLQPRKERPEPFRSHSKFGEVPLILLNDEPYVQSNAILLLLSDQLNKMGGEKYQQQVCEWLMWEQSRIGFSLPNLQFERMFAKDTDPAVLSWLEKRLRNDLTTLDMHLETDNSFIVGSRPTIADCSLVGYLYWLDDTGLNISHWPNIEKWLARISKLEGWRHPDVSLQ